MKRAQPPPVYCVVPLEFIPPWDHARRIRQVKGLRLGNATLLSFTFHIGNRAKDRQRWKTAFPEMAAVIDSTPRFLSRPQFGMARIVRLPLDFWIEKLRLCRRLGLKVLTWPLRRTVLSATDAARLGEAGKDCVLLDSIMEESTSILGHGFRLSTLRGMKRLRPHADAEGLDGTREVPELPLPKSAKDLDLHILHDWFLHPYQTEVARARALGSTRFGCIEASAQIRLAMEAGVNVPILELVPYHPYEGLAAVRGAARAYGASMWGVHTAMGYYQAPTNAWTPERLRIAYNLFYAGGASLFSEPNIAFQNVGLCSAFFSEKASPPIRLGEREIRGFHDPVCARGREVLAEHYRFTQFHVRPDGGPRVRLGFVLGHLDGWVGGDKQTHVWCVDDPAFAAGSAEQTWHHFRRMYDTEPWCDSPRKYYWQADPAKPLRHGTPPCGQLDLVPIEGDLQRYRCLVFLGWNTMTPEHYARLCRYVKSGGRLLMSVPHLSTRLRRDAPMNLIHGGDFRDLFGVKVVGPGKVSEDVQLVAQSGYKPYVLPVGTLYLESAPLARVSKVGQASCLSSARSGKRDRQDACPTVRVLARSRAGEPVLVEHRLGKGFAWLLATWDYPGHRLDAFLTDLLRTIAEGEQDDIAVEGTDVDYAIYDDGPLAVVYLVNKNIYGQPQEPTLIVRGQRFPIRVEGYGMRIAWVSGDLLISPLDRFVKVSCVHGRKVAFVARKGLHHVQVNRSIIKFCHTHRGAQTVMV